MATKSKVLIVTGASRGIGLATAHFLLKKSHRLVVVARSEGPLHALEKEYPDDQVEILTGDLSDLSLGEKAVQQATKRWKTLDGIIINHGVLDPVKRIADTAVSDWQADDVREHREILAAVREARAEDAARLMEEHVRRAMRHWEPERRRSREADAG